MELRGQAEVVAVCFLPGQCLRVGNLGDPRPGPWGPGEKGFTFLSPGAGTVPAEGEGEGSCLGLFNRGISLLSKWRGELPSCLHSSLEGVAGMGSPKFAPVSPFPLPASLPIQAQSLFKCKHQEAPLHCSQVYGDMIDQQQLCRKPELIGKEYGKGAWRAQPRWSGGNSERRCGQRVPSLCQSWLPAHRHGVPLLSSHIGRTDFWVRAPGVNPLGIHSPGCLI